jgi:hypothetical protein
VRGGLVGWLVGWSVGLLVVGLVLFCRLVVWLAGRLVDGTNLARLSSIVGCAGELVLSDTYCSFGADIVFQFGG